MIVEVHVGGRRRAVEVRRVSAGWEILLDGTPWPADAVDLGSDASGRRLAPSSAGHWSVLSARSEPPPDHDARPDDTAGMRPAGSYEIAIDDRGGGDMVVHVNGEGVPVSVTDPYAVRATGRIRGGLAPEGHGPGPARVMAPMPGRITKVLVAAGETVSLRQPLVVVEAMKMENELRAPKAGTVAEVRVTEGMTVEANAVLMIVE